MTYSFEASNLLGGLTPEQFLALYWQKKPLLIRNAFADLRLQFNGSELAGLSCESGIYSRIVIEKGGLTPWQVSLGPFRSDHFKNLPKTHWTLLVQEVNHFVPEIEALRDCFRFVPDWRVDDVMVSYAVDKGGVGPHLDQYDVFLLQGKGKRRWRIETKKRADDYFIPGLDLKILESFQPDFDEVLEPGDMLYLPPGFAHEGTAEGDCLTLSIGFRAPSVAEILMAKAQFLAETQQESNRYFDPDLKLQQNPAEITGESIQRVKAILRKLSEDDSAIAHFFGGLVTQPRREEALIEVEKKKGSLQRRPGARLAFYRDQDRILVFADGQRYEVATGAGEIVGKLCRDKQIPMEEIEAAYKVEGFRNLIRELCDAGVLG